MEKEGRPHHAHVLVVPLPSQGHINPLLQFSKRLHSKGIKVTMAITKSVAKTMHAETGPIGVETFSDGYDEGIRREDINVEEYFKRLVKMGSQSLAELIKKHESMGDPISCIVYDSFIPWVLDVAKNLNLIGASFFTQSCAVTFIYYHVQRGLLTVPVAETVTSIPGLPPLATTDLPSFVNGSFPLYLAFAVSQFPNIHKADWLLFNAFDKLEQEEVNCMGKILPVKTIGPAMPSTYLDKRVEEDEIHFGLNLFDSNAETCMNWLNMREPGSVVYVAFGSLAELGDEQMKELAASLKEINDHFLWVVRQTEEKKLPSNFVKETLEKGLVVSWSPQLEVLSHKAVGCFVTHCGWNSTLESLSLGVPLVALPQWTDQPTNAKYIQDVWGMGLRVKEDETGIAVQEEIEACVKEVMHGEKGKEIRKNGLKWKELAKEAVDEGGSSDRNIDEFVALLGHAP